MPSSESDTSESVPEAIVAQVTPHPPAAHLYPPVPIEVEPDKNGEARHLQPVISRRRPMTFNARIPDPIERKCKNMPLTIHYESIQRMLRWLCCYFHGRRGSLFILSIVVNVIVWTASCYQLIYALVVVSRSQSISSNTSVVAVMIIWALQSLISHLFLIRWQLNGELEVVIKHLTAAHDPTIHKLPDKKLRQVIIAFYISITFTAFVNIASIGLTMSGIRVEIFKMGEHKLNFSQVYYFEVLHMLRTFFTFYTFVTFSLSVAIFALFCRGTTIQFEYLNDTISKIGIRADSVQEDLLEAMRVHMKLLVAIRDLNSAFEVYAFLMLGTVVPITIFSVFMFIFTMSMTWIDVIVSLPSLAVSVTQLSVFILIPAALNTSVESTKQTVLANERLWIPFKEEVYHIVTAVLTHASQTDRGITIWGFAVVTKPMIMTTVSMVVTSIAFLLELRRDEQTPE